MQCCVFALATVLVFPAAAAPEGDPLHAGACREAVQALEVQEAALPSASAASAALQTARQRVAHVCLGSRNDPPQLTRPAQPPLALPPVASPPPALPAVPTPIPPPPVAAPAPPPRIVRCDVAGCTLSDGSRLPRVGGGSGAAGLCTVQGTVAVCR